MVRWILLYVAIGSVVMLIVTPGHVLDILGPHDFTAGFASAMIASSVLLLCITHILLWYVYHRVYPRAMRNRWCCVNDLDWFFQIRPTSKPGQYHYRIPLPFPFWLPCCGQARTAQSSPATSFPMG